MYKELRALLEAGYEVTLRPAKKDTVTLTVQEAKSGTVKGVEVDLGIMEWGLCEKGIADRLQEAATALGMISPVV